MTAVVRDLDAGLPKIKAPKRQPAARKPSLSEKWRDGNDPRTPIGRDMAQLLRGRADFFFERAESSSRSNHWNYATIYRMFASRLDIARNANNPEQFVRSMHKVFQSLTEELGMIADDLARIAENHNKKADTK